LMSYLGALKSWIYAPLLHAVEISQWSLRVPPLLLSIATIAAASVFAWKIGGQISGLLLAWLLSTDVTFLLTAVFDWGPVVLQNLLLVGGMILAIECWRTGRNRLLFLAGLLFGLALWDKALFIWNLSAMAVAFAIVNPHALLRLMRLKPAACAVLGLALGAGPLVYFNLTTDRSTFAENTKFTLRDLAPKARYFVEAVDGIKAETEWCDRTFQPRNGTQPLASVSSWRSYIMLIALPLGILFSRTSQRKWLLFFMLSAGIAWFQAAITVGAGGSMHHAVLIWPFMYCALALSFTTLLQARLRFAKPIVLLIPAIACLRGLETLKATGENLSNYSHTIPWTDADAPLSNLLMSTGVNRVLAADWGIANVVATRTADRVSVVDESFELSDGRFDKDRFVNCKAPACAVVSHVQERSIFRPAQMFFEEHLRGRGLTHFQSLVIRDSHGSPAFVVYSIR
jgi:hypothetical protein